LNYLAAVQEFHDACGVYTPPMAGFVDDDTIEMRLNLIKEEARELQNAVLGCDFVEVADALADLTYVTLGMALQLGIPLDEVFAEVHRSNMTKTIGGVQRRGDGKILKGPYFEPPNLAPILGLTDKCELCGGLGEYDGEYGPATCVPCLVGAR
jgi:NTP pyrophosphatase (non-canonical NTP hydrolase)